MLHVTLEGTRVRLEPLEPRHEEPLWEAARGDDRIFRWFPVVANESRESFHAWFENVRELWLPFAQVVGGVPLGSTSYGNVREHDRVLEIGNTWLAPQAWNTGANAEAKYLLMEHAFEHEGFHRVEFKTDEQNERARAALAALPSQFEGVFRKHMVVRGGQRRDSAWYAVIDDDWPEVKATLRERLARKPAAG
ncbi:MAG TPA: GNAT family protein [Gaiellaceae bacterium]|nr:GNAT family protein [Gaiellaceae bacterium]